jgi:hypothetical protein
VKPVCIVQESADQMHVHAPKSLTLEQLRDVAAAVLTAALRRGVAVNEVVALLEPNTFRIPNPSRN